MKPVVERGSSNLRCLPRGSVAIHEYLNGCRWRWPVRRRTGNLSCSAWTFHWWRCSSVRCVISRLPPARRQEPLSPSPWCSRRRNLSTCDGWGWTLRVRTHGQWFRLQVGCRSGIRCSIRTLPSGHFRRTNAAYLLTLFLTSTAVFRGKILWIPRLIFSLNSAASYC